MSLLFTILLLIGPRPLNASIIYFYFDVKLISLVICNNLWTDLVDNLLYLLLILGQQQIIGLSIAYYVKLEFQLFLVLFFAFWILCTRIYLGIHSKTSTVIFLIYNYTYNVYFLCRDSSFSLSHIISSRDKNDRLLKYSEKWTCSQQSVGRH